MTDTLEKWAARLLPQRNDEADEQGKDSDLRFLREGRDALRRSGYLDLQPGSAEVLPDPVRALGGAGANMVGQAVMGAGAPILGGALAGAGAGQLEGADAGGTALSAGLGAAIPAAIKGAPAAYQYGKSFLDRITAPAPELAMARAAPSFRPPRGAAPVAAPARARTAIAPGAGSIPPEYSPEIPKAGKTGFRPSQVPVADELAEAADVVHGDKLLGRELGSDDVSRFAAARDKLKPAPEPTTGVRTVRPGRRAKTPGPKLPSETGKRVPRDAEQLPVSFPAEPKGLHWLEGQLKKTGEAPLDDVGINASKRVDFETPEGPKSAVFKPQEGAMPFLGLPKESIPQREAAAHDWSRALFKDNAPVPKTVVRDVDGATGSLQEFVPDTKSAAQLEELVPRPELRGSSPTLAPAQRGYQGINIAKTPEIAEAVAERGKDPSYQRTLLGDASAGSFDRHGRNLRVDATGKAVAIDNGYSFPTSGKQFRVPFENQKFLHNATDVSPEVAAELQRASLKEAAAAARKPGISKEQQRQALGRLRDLQTNPKQLSGLTDYEIADWMKTPYEKRGLPTSTLMDIEAHTGGIPSKHISMADAPKLGVKPLEGEQLSLTDLLSKLR